MEFKARWIWVDSHLDSRNCYVYTRKEFTIPAAPSAEAYVSCSGEYKLYVNGRYVGRGANYAQDYDTHDLSHVIRSGKNVIAALCHNPGGDAGLPAGFILQLEITRNGEPEQLICTDESWSVKLAEEWEPNSVPIDSGRFQEIYDSRKKPVGWNVVGFDDSDWAAPAICDGLPQRLKARQTPPLRERYVHPKQVIDVGRVISTSGPSPDVASQICAESVESSPAAIKYPKEMLTVSGEAAVVSPNGDSYVVLDFGAETVGYPCLRTRGGGQGIVDIGYSEILDANGRVWPTRGGMLQADRLVLHGGRQEWQAFGRRVFRYVQLTFRSVESPIYVESVSAVASGYPVEQVSTFECSDDLLNRIWQTGVYTLNLCMQDKYECRPGSPEEDAEATRLQALFNNHCFFDAALAADALESDQSGCLSWLQMLHDYHLYTGDLALVQQLYPRVEEVLDRQAADLVDDRLDCIYRHAKLVVASRLARIVSSTEDAARWHHEAEELKQKWNDHFWCRAASIAHQEGAEWFERVQSALLETGLDIVDGGKLDEAWGLLNPSELASVPPRRLFYVLQLLLRRNETEQQAIDLIRGVWGAMLQRGATTCWDCNPLQDTACDEAAMCSGSAASPVFFLPAQVLGVTPASPGQVTIAPKTVDLQWAKGHVKTAAGYVDVEWRRVDGVFRIDIEAQPGFIVGLPLDGFVDPVVDEFDLTPETPERRARKTYGWGNTIWRGGAERDPYLDWLASQETEPPASYAHRDRCTSLGSRLWVRESVSTHVRYEIHEANSGI